MTPAERDALRDLAARQGGGVRFDTPLADHTTWQIGGPAEAMVHPTTREGILAAVALATAQGWPWRVMGNGSNLLCPDEGVAGLVLNLTNSYAGLRFEGCRLTAEAGAFLPRLARDAAQRGLAGLECVVGVPGTVGGGCVLNAGIPAGTLGDRLVDVEVLLPDGQVRRVPRDELALGHRTSRLQHEPWLLLQATFELEPADPAALQAAMAEHLAYRRRTQPLREATCGSVFRRPPDDYPGRLIEAAGCKGLRVGQAVVSDLHANWIVNRGGATAADVLALIDEIRARVLAQSGVDLVPEVIVW